MLTTHIVVNTQSASRGRMSVRTRIKQTKYETLGLEAVLAIQVTAAYYEQQVSEVFERHGVTIDQYNVLRILRGVYPNGHPRYEISDRLVRRAPDVTRLLDRLEREGLVERVRDDNDRRLCITRITKAGLTLLDEIEPERLTLQNEVTARVSDADLRDVVRICNQLVP